METETVTQTADLIQLNMTIGDVISKYPSAVEVLLKHGVHCVGCGAKNFETLQEGFTGHGFAQDKIQTILKELNAAATPTGKTDGDITITSKAVEKLKGLIKDNNKEGFGLRVQVIPGGCAGFQYGFDFEDTAKDGDEVKEIDGVKFYIDAQSMSHLGGSTIDYIDTLQEAGFRISNPNASSGCGCGKSFS